MAEAEQVPFDPNAAIGIPIAMLGDANVQTEVPA
jgi:hypothetical protein